MENDGLDLDYLTNTKSKFNELEKKLNTHFYAVNSNSNNLNNNNISKKESNNIVYNDDDNNNFNKDDIVKLNKFVEQFYNNQKENLLIKNDNKEDNNIYKNNLKDILSDITKEVKIDINTLTNKNYANILNQIISEKIEFIKLKEIFLEKIKTNNKELNHLKQLKSKNIPNVNGKEADINIIIKENNNYIKNVYTENDQIISELLEYKKNIFI